MYAEEREQAILPRVRETGPVEPAAPPPRSPQTDRRDLHSLEKDAIARRAVEELPHTGAILVDAGSTTRRFAELLPNDRELHVVTNSLTIGLALATRGDWTLRCVGHVNVDVAFIATSGLSVSRGLTSPDPFEAATKRAMIASARRVVVLADHTKIGDDYVAPFGDLSDIDLLITDSGLRDDATAELTAAGLTVVRVDPLSPRTNHV
jgi:DeoR family fructose operon transcriptional repressor